LRSAPRLFSGYKFELRWIVVVLFDTMIESGRILGLPEVIRCQLARSIQLARTVRTARTGSLTPR
jgi:hypothetical protein